MFYDKNHPRLFVGPMSKEIVDCSIEYSTTQHVELGFIPSRRQIEVSGGYVNNWSTHDFVEYVRKQCKTTSLVRDHGGPGQGLNLDSGLDSLEEDIRCGFDILHIDPWKESQSIEMGIDSTIQIIEHCMKLSDSVCFEIGTEAAIYPYSSLELEKIISNVKLSLRDRFDRVKYAVVQSGVQISGTKNIGVFDPTKLSEMSHICHKFGLISKEHNGDYLSTSDIQSRVELGLDCINIAPEFGVIQTRLMMDILSNDQFMSVYDECLNSKKWVKWFPKEFSPEENKDKIIEASGHYMFTREPFKSLHREIISELKDKLFKRYNEIISCWDK